MRITNNGVVPEQTQITVGSRVLFVNESTIAHEIASDPHPIHTNCPEINPVSLLNPGQQKMTSVFASAKTCGYHDHIRPDDTRFHGTIRVQ